MSAPPCPSRGAPSAFMSPTALPAAGRRVSSSTGPLRRRAPSPSPPSAAGGAAAPTMVAAMDPAFPVDVALVFSVAAAAGSAYFITGKKTARIARGALESVKRTGFTQWDVNNVKRASDIAAEGGDAAQEKAAAAVGVAASLEEQAHAHAGVAVVGAEGGVATLLPVVDDFEMEFCAGGGEIRVSERLEEELKWAVGQVMDCGAGGAAVYSASGELMWRDGVLSGNDWGPGGPVLEKVAASGEGVVFDCQPGAAEVPACFSEEVRNCAILPIGDDKPHAVLAVVSDEEGFYNTREERTCRAVCARLATFLFVERFKNWRDREV